MAKPAVPPTARDEQVRILLRRYSCPVPFHAVRTRFLGNIASPDPQASPIRVIESLWGGSMPEFASIDAANELVGALMMGLWNRLSRHQQRSAPFRLTRFEVPATLDGLARISLLRREELEGFAAGLFGESETMDLPQRAHEAMTVLADIRSMTAATYDLGTDLAMLARTQDIAGTLGHLRELTRIAEHEMHELVLSCKRARQDALKGMPATRPVLH